MVCRASLLAFLAVAATTVTACSASSTDDNAEDNKNAVIFGAEKSPFANGTYDAPNGMIHLSGSSGSQQAKFLASVKDTDGENELADCSGTIAVNDGRASLADARGQCTLDLRVVGSGLDVSGKVGLEGIVRTLPGSIAFAKRGPNALARTYQTDRGVTLVIESSDDAGFTFTLTNAGKSERGRASTVAGDRFDLYDAPTAGCAGRVALSRKNGNFTLVASRSVPAEANESEIAKCPLQNDDFDPK